MKLFLTSAGLPVATRNYFFSLLTKKPQEIKLAFIPTAGYPETNKSYIEKDKNQIRSLGIGDMYEVDLKGENSQSLHKKLSSADVIYVTGGNTFYLLDWVRKSGFDVAIRQLVNAGKIYIGASAGSYIACPTIEMSTWKGGSKNVVNLTDFTALHFVPFLLKAHFKEEHQELIEKSVKTAKLPVIVLTDKQAVKVINDSWEIVGKGKKMTFNFDKGN